MKILLLGIRRLLLVRTGLQLLVAPDMALLMPEVSEEERANIAKGAVLMAPRSKVAPRPNEKRISMHDASYGDHS